MNSTTIFFRSPLLALVVVAALLFPGIVSAREIELRPGESFREGDLSVTCREAGEGAKPIEITECQYWDDFHKRCLFEKTKFIFRGLECTEECRHWDSFNGVCHYQTSCRFVPEQGAFVRTECVEFDDFSNRCLRTGEKVINGSGRRLR
ncbi:MAG: hypothetical protein ACOY4H_08715 [Thermodesulfobacteriota bacterium]